MERWTKVPLFIENRYQLAFVVGEPIVCAKIAEECHERIDLRFAQYPLVISLLQKVRMAVAVRVGFSVFADLKGGAPLEKPAYAEAEHAIIESTQRPLRSLVSYCVYALASEI